MFGAAGSPSPTRTKSPTSGSPPLLLSESPARTSPHGTPLVPALPALGRRSVRSMSDTDSRLDVRGPPSPTLEVVQGARSHLISPSVGNRAQGHKLKWMHRQSLCWRCSAPSSCRPPQCYQRCQTEDHGDTCWRMLRTLCLRLAPLPRPTRSGTEVQLERWAQEAKSKLVGWLVGYYAWHSAVPCNYCSPRSEWQQL